MRRRGRQRLVEAGIGADAAGIEADLLLADAAGVDRTWLLAHGADAAGAEVEGRLESLIRRREGREPLQYIRGTTEFYGLAIGCDPRALIPRPETETVVTEALARIGVGAGRRVADVGTGSGAIALALAHARPDIAVVATDESPEALALARANAQRLGLSARINFLRGDLVKPLRTLEPLDVVVSNPPYVSSAEMAGLAPELSFEPRAALVSDDGDGTRVLRALASAARLVLRPGGWLLMELASPQAPAVQAELRRLGWRDADVRPDLAGRPRVAVGRLPD